MSKCKPENEIISKKISQLRKEAGLKQEQLAELVEEIIRNQYPNKTNQAGDRTVGSWEQGKRRPTFDYLMALSDIFRVSIDVFRDDITDITLPHPIDKPPQATDDTPYYKGVPLRFGSVKPVAEKAAMLDFCEAYLSSLPSQYFIKSTGQNSEYGTGRYFWESKIDMLMFIGITPPLQGTHPGFAFSVALAVDEPLDEETISEFGCLQLTDEDDTTWIYAPIKCDAPFAFGDELSPQQKKAADTALKAIMQVARKVLDKSLSEIFYEA